MIKYILKIIDIIDEAKGTKTYYLEKPEDLNWEEGAHTHIGLIGFDAGEKPNKDLVRHMSIMTLPDENKIGFTTRIPGSSSEFKNKLSDLKIGDSLVLFKLGSRFSLRRDDKPIVLISMGVGITTMRPLILTYSKDKTKIPNLTNLNVDSSGNFVYKYELDKLVDNNYKNLWLDSRKTFYESIDSLNESKDAVYYITGSDSFIKDVIQKLKSKNIDVANIVIDKREAALPDFFL